jgi:hypothetical protein
MDDFGFVDMALLIQRSIVHGRKGKVKTGYSRDYVLFDPALGFFWNTESGATQSLGRQAHGKVVEMILKPIVG